VSYSPAEYGIVGAIALALLGVIAWALRAIVRAFIDELKAAREERAETTERLATVMGEASGTMQMQQQSLVGAVATMGEIRESVRDHEQSSATRHRDVQQRLHRLTALLGQPDGSGHEDPAARR